MSSIWQTALEIVRRVGARGSVILEEGFSSGDEPGQRLPVEFESRLRA